MGTSFTLPKYGFQISFSLAGLGSEKGRTVGCGGRRGNLVWVQLLLGNASFNQARCILLAIYTEREREKEKKREKKKRDNRRN